LKLDGLLVASEWDNPLLKQLIYAYKYSFVQELAAPLSMIIGEYLKVNFLDIEPRQEMVLISVPLHPRRLAWRDFDQAELLAKTVSQISSVPFAEKVLIRHRYTLPQADIHDQAARRSNIKNAFSLAKNYSPNSNPLKDKIIILVDDVATTGATFQECVKVLKPLSPREIWGLVVARG
jgi:ComF family protein